jgi:hypothetical protein
MQFFFRMEEVRWPEKAVFSQSEDTEPADQRSCIPLLLRYEFCHIQSGFSLSFVTLNLSDALFKTEMFVAIAAAAAAFFS